MIKRAYLAPAVLEKLLLQRCPLAVSIKDLTFVADLPWPTCRGRSRPPPPSAPWKSCDHILTGPREATGQVLKDRLVGLVRAAGLDVGLATVFKRWELDPEHPLGDQISVSFRNCLGVAFQPRMKGVFR